MANVIVHLDEITCSAKPCKKPFTTKFDCQNITQVSVVEWVKCQFVLHSCDAHMATVGDMSILHLLERHPEKVPTELMQEVVLGIDPFDMKNRIKRDPSTWSKLSAFMEACRVKGR